MNKDHRMYLIKFYVSETLNSLNHHKNSCNKSDNIKIAFKFLIQVSVYASSLIAINDIIFLVQDYSSPFVTETWKQTQLIITKRGGYN